MGYTISDLKGISPAICTHRINIEDGVHPSIEPFRRVNPNRGEVIKKEINKLLDTYIIYAVPDSKWVVPVHVVPKKGGMTVIMNDKHE